MSEINSILTSSNKFLYNQSKLPETTQSINYFGIQWFPVVSVHKHDEFTERIMYGDTKFIDSPLLLFHVHGYFIKPLTSTIEKYTTVNLNDVNDLGVIIPANPYSKTDYFDFMYIRPAEHMNDGKSNGYRIACYTFDANNKFVDDTFTVDITVDIFAP